MTTQSKRATIYFDPELHRALRVRAAETNHSISELVNEAVRLGLAGDESELAPPVERTYETALHLENVLYVDQQGVPRVGESGMKVIHLVMAQQAHGYSSAELHFQFPDLSMSEIYKALAYYWEHKAELDAAIAQHDQFVEHARQNWGESQAVKRLRLSGHLSSGYVA